MRRTQHGEEREQSVGLEMSLLPAAVLAVSSGRESGASSLRILTTSLEGRRMGPWTMSAAVAGSAGAHLEP